jgi:nucleoside-diphosphate-sugar epimerase
MTKAVESLSRQRILVTGASGFLGSHLCDRLSQLGAEVHATSRSPKRADGSLHWWQANLENIDEARQLFRNLSPDILFHLSGYATGAADVAQVLPTFHSQLVSKLNLLIAATELGCQRLIFTASLEEPQSGKGEITPGSPYAASKWAGGAYARMFHKLYQTPVVLARIFMTYGPRQNANKIIPSVTLSLLRGEAPLLGSGLRLVDWIYVDDVVDGLLAMAHVPGIEGLTFDLGSGKLMSVRAVVDQLVEHINSRIEPLFDALPDRPVETVRIADTALAGTTLNWKPATSL